MPVITDITEQKKRAGYYNIFVDGKYNFSLSDLDLVSQQLRINQNISSSELEDLQKLSSNSKAYNYALRYLALRPRSCKEVADYLARKGFEPDAGELVIEKLITQKYLNDQDFACMWVRNRMLLNARSTRVLRLELYKKGIDKEYIEAALADVSDQDQLDVLKELIHKKRRLKNYQDDEKLKQYLLRNGYTYQLIKSALEDLVTSYDES